MATYKYKNYKIEINTFHDINIANTTIGHGHSLYRLNSYFELSIYHHNEVQPLFSFRLKHQVTEKPEDRS